MPFIPLCFCCHRSVLAHPFYRWNLRVQKKDTHCPRLPSEKQLRFVVRTEVLFNLGPAFLIWREVGELRVSMSLMGSAWQGRDTEKDPDQGLYSEPMMSGLRCWP